MNKKVYIIGSLIVTAMAIGYWASQFGNETLGLYSEKSTSIFGSNEKQAKGADEALEWLKARYVDVQTGQQVTEEKLLQIRKQISKLGHSKNIAFTEEGPDNIGGRTREIGRAHV